MLNNGLLKIFAFAFVVFIIAVMAWLTLSGTEEDPCADPQTDISAAVIADEAGDQDALVNRAIIMRGKCKKTEDDKDQ